MTTDSSNQTRPDDQSADEQGLMRQHGSLLIGFIFFAALILLIALG